MLEKINLIITSVKNVSKLEEKQNILKKYISDFIFQKFLIYCYSPYKNYNITIKDLQKNSELSELDFDIDLFKICDLLESKKIYGKQAIAKVNGFINQNQQYLELLYNFFDRNLKIGLNIDQLNRIFHNIIPRFETIKLEKYDEQKKSLYNLEKYCIERKLDGVHVLAFIYYNNGKPYINYVSDQNKQFKTLEKITEELLPIYMDSLYKGKDIVLDGNVCIIEEDNFDNWTRIKTEILRKKHIIEHPKYYCFDILLLEEFQGLKRSMNYDIRYRNLKQFIANDNKKWKILTYLFAAPYTDSNFELLKKEYLDTEKWDGFVFRKFVPFNPIESVDILKYSLYKQDIAEVKSIEKTLKLILDPNNDKIEEKPCIGSLIINYQYENRRILFGMTDDQRTLWYDHPDLIIGKTISFKYIENNDKTLTNFKFVSIFDSKRIQK